jgi:ribosomal protein S18 acetylase RimI-like enzyme
MDNIIETTDSVIVTDVLNKAFMTVALHFNFTKETVPFFPAFLKPDVIENQLNNGLKMFGYNISGKMAGCIGYSYYKDDIYLIERLATLPDYRHSGIGKKLVEYVENKIKENGGKIAEVHVVSINMLLIDWYKKLGYNVIRTEKLGDDKIKKPFDLCVMGKKLT